MQTAPFFSLNFMRRIVYFRNCGAMRALASAYPSARRAIPAKHQARKTLGSFIVFCI
jgi:hypothetical protein